jgi:hypothetical protein
MQAIKYAAMASRFDLDLLADARASFITNTIGDPLTSEDATERLEAHTEYQISPSSGRSTAPSRRREGAPPSRASHAVRTCTYRLSRPASVGGSVVADRTFRRRPDASPQPSIKSASSSLELGRPACWRPGGGGRWTRACRERSGVLSGGAPVAALAGAVGASLFVDPNGRRQAPRRRVALLARSWGARSELVPPATAAAESSLVGAARDLAAGPDPCSGRALRSGRWGPRP